MKKQVDDPGGPGSPAAREKKTKNSAESGRKVREEGPKRGGPTSKAARKTPVRRDGSESRSSWTYQGFVQGKVARRHQKTCLVVLQAYCQGVVRTDAFGEGDVSRCDAHGNSRDSRRSFRQPLFDT